MFLKNLVSESIGDAGRSVYYKAKVTPDVRYRTTFNNHLLKHGVGAAEHTRGVCLHAQR